MELRIDFPWVKSTGQVKHKLMQKFYSDVEAVFQESLKKYEHLNM